MNPMPLTRQQVSYGQVENEDVVRLFQHLSPPLDQHNNQQQVGAERGHCDQREHHPHRRELGLAARLLRILLHRPVRAARVL